MGRKKSNRGSEPTELTVRILCSRAAGMCQFCGCDKRLFYDTVTLADFNNSYVAHIIASSPGGPRGSIELSHQLSNDVSNLMLMCGEHHTLIDHDKETYTVEKLKTMKTEHESKISELCSYFNVPKTELLVFSSPIKGSDVVIDIKVAAQAVLPKKQPQSPYGQNIKVSSVHPYKSKEYWADVLTQLECANNYTIKNILSTSPQTHFSVFPLAPMPLIIKLGELFGDKIQADIFQKMRIPDTWKWQSTDSTNTFSCKTSDVSDGNTIVVAIALTSDISDERISKAVDVKCMYKIFAEKSGVDCIKSQQDLSDFWHIYQNTMDDILNRYSKNCDVCLFMAMPASAAFEVGRRYMPMIYPEIRIFDDAGGFFETITIGGEHV